MWNANWRVSLILSIRFFFFSLFASFQEFANLGAERIPIFANGIIFRFQSVIQEIASSSRIKPNLGNPITSLKMRYKFQIEIPTTEMKSGSGLL